MFVLDSHCDTPSQIYRLRDIGVRNAHGQVDFPKMKDGGVDGAFFALYVPSAFGPEKATSYAMELLAGVCDTLARNRDKAVLVTNASEAYEAKSKGLLSVFLGQSQNFMACCFDGACFMNAHMTCFSGNNRFVRS